MPYEYTPPKYAQIIAELQRRIESGEYPPGSLLPSEHQLSAEFGTARPTVVRALRELRQAEWIETQQGKGSFVRGRPALARGSERRGQAELDRDESREPGELISAGRVPAPARVAAMLGVKPGSELVSRRRLIRQEDGEASEILTWWLSPELAGQTGLGAPDPVRGGIRNLLARTAGVRIDYVVEQIAARRADPHEAKLLGITKSAPVLALYVSACNASGRPVVALDMAMPGDLHELEDTYPVT
ncbi:MAG: GntR family transcriptional regulator [Actinomycetota bacterium]|nr:GntR family transcriptional regulator [Actinomycetota bacterium]